MTMPELKPEYSIGAVTSLLGISADTLRYYEKIGLLPPIHRSASGVRRYVKKDISRLRFIQRAKTMNFSLQEISLLLAMREDPQNARVKVRQLTRIKLVEIESRLAELSVLKNELTLLVNLCQAAGEGCPILEDIQSGKPA